MQITADANASPIWFRVSKVMPNGRRISYDLHCLPIMQRYFLPMFTFSSSIPGG